MQYVCPIGTCKQPFTNPGNLASHLKRKHPKPSRRPLIAALAASPSRNDGSSGEASLGGQDEDHGPQPASDDSDFDELDAFNLGTCFSSDEFDDLYDAAVNAQDGPDSSQKFDTNTELLLFLARSGLSASLQQDLLDLLHHKEFDPKQILFKTVRDKLKWEAALISGDTDNTWITSEFSVTEFGQPVHIRFDHVDTAHWLEVEFSKKEYSSDFTLWASVEEAIVDGVRQRVISKPANANRWISHQASIEHGGVVAALQFYSDKTLINNKGASAHPLRLSLLNAGYAARMQLKNLATVGYMPIIARPAGMTNDTFRRLKHVVRQRCLRILLQPLKQLSHECVFINDPDGKAQLVFPRLLSIVGDHPEISDLLAIFSSGTPQRPCSRCLAPRSSMHDITEQHPARTMQTHQQMMREVATAGAGRGAVGRVEAVKQRWSSHAVPLGLAGFAGEDTEHGNLFQCSGYDTLHTDYLGTWLDLVRSFKPYATAAGGAVGARFIRLVNEYLAAMPRCENLKLPSMGEEGYIKEDGELKGHLQAQEHRSVMQLLPCVVLAAAHDAFTDEAAGLPLVELVFRYVEVHMMKTCRNRPELYTRDSLLAIDEKQAEYGALVKEHLVPLPGVFKAELRNPKWHIQAHFTQTVLELGPPRHYDSNFYEAAHKLIKTAYRQGSRKRGRDANHPQYMEELVRSHMRNLTLMSMDAAMSSRQKEDSAKKYATAHIRAHETGEPQMYANSLFLDLKVLTCLASDTALPSMSAAQLLPTVKAHEQQPDLAELPALLLEYLQSAVASSTRHGAQPTIPDRVSLVKGAVICGRYDWSPDHAILETVRATASFHGAEYFDSVAVASGVEGQLWYAQLRALFWMATADGAKHQVALVRWYEEVDTQATSASLSDQLASEFGCRRLRWEQQHRRGTQVPRYSVIQLDSIVRRQCIVPDCSKRNCMVRQRGAAGGAQSKPHFYINPFLWARI